jgi:hypothetical protein
MRSSKNVTLVKGNGIVLVTFCTFFRKLYLLAGLGSLSAVLYFVYQGYLETRVNTPLDYPK